MISCAEEQTLKTQTEKPPKEMGFLKTDQRFVGMLENNITLLGNVRDIKVAQILLEKEKLTKQDLEYFSIALGFDNFKSYEKFIDTQKKVLFELNNEYNLIGIEDSKFISIGVEALNLKYSNKTAKESTCERIRRNCLIEVAGGAILGHLACASVDWTGIGAPICHGAVFVVQIAASDNCNANATLCDGPLQE